MTEQVRSRRLEAGRRPSSLSALRAAAPIALSGLLAGILLAVLGLSLTDLPDRWTAEALQLRGQVLH